MISTQMLKLYGDSALPPLELIFTSCLESGTFPSELKKTNLVPVHKKGDKQSLKTLSSHIITPCLWKNIWTTDIQQMFWVLHWKQFNLSGDSYVRQLLPTHQIYKSFDEGYEARGVFLDISEAFHKVWYKGLFHKFKENGVSDNLLDAVTGSLYQQKQKIVLIGQYSCWAVIETGVPQGSIIGTLFFLTQINNLTDDLASNPKLLIHLYFTW